MALRSLSNLFLRAGRESGVLLEAGGVQATEPSVLRKLLCWALVLEHDHAGPLSPRDRGPGEGEGHRLPPRGQSDRPQVSGPSVTRPGASPGGGHCCGQGGQRWR